jgi:peptidoglycan DL-endopeptidase CwlO
MTLVQMMSSMQQIQSMIASMAQNSPAVSDSSSSNFDQVMSTVSSSSTADASSIAPGSAGGTVTGADVVADAKKYLGVPYVLDGESNKGMDCSGLVQQTYKDLGITLPRTVHQQKLMGTAVPSLAQAQPGDLIVFKGGGHVAIYEGNDTVIHAPYPGRVVSNEKLWVGDSGIETIRRIVPTSTSTTSAAAPSVTPAAAPTSATLQAAALAAVQATIQADSSLLLGSTSALGSSGSADPTSSSDTTDSMQSAITSLENASGVDTSSGTSATSTTSPSTAAAIQQFITTEEASLGEAQP